MKPFTSKHCTPISYGSPVKHTSQKYGKDNEGHYHYKDKSGKPMSKFSTTPVKHTSQKYGKDNEGHYHYKDKEGKPLAKFSTTPLNNKKKIEKLKEKISETEKKAFIRSNYPSEGYETSLEEIRAQKKLKRLNKRLAKKEQK